MDDDCAHQVSETGSNRFSSALVIAGQRRQK